MDIFKPLDDFLSYLESERKKAQGEILRAEDELKKLEKRNNVMAVFLTVILLTALIWGSATMNSPKRLISGRLVAAGYSANDLTVEKTNISGVYKASVPAVAEDGQLIEMWEVKPIPGFQTIWGATPYQEQIIRKNEMVNISFTPEEYEQLLTLAQQNEESIEDLIKRQVIQ